MMTIALDTNTQPGMRPSQHSRVLVGQQSAVRELPPEAARSIAGAVRQLLEQADDRPRLIMSPGRLDEVRARERYVEVIHETPIAMTVLGQSIEVHRVFVPLSGDLAKGYVMYATPVPGVDGPATYGAGNTVRNSTGTKNLMQVLRDHGAGFD